MKGYGARMKRGIALLKKLGQRGPGLAVQKELYADLYELSVGHLFGDIWTRPHLTLRERQIITLAVNIGLCRPRGTPPHFRSALHLGFTKDEIMEIIIHAGTYAGWSAMGNAAHQFKDVLDELAREGRLPKGLAKKPARKRRRR
jgi:4-carboxymuconolactone decarboxylase